MEANMERQFDQLLLRAREGCLQSRGELFERYRKLLKMLVRLQLYSPLQVKVDPSDVVQEAFVNAHRVFHQFQGETERQIIAWLRSILASRLLNTVRHHQAARRAAHLERRLEDELEQSSLALDRAFLDAGPSPSEFVSRREALAALASAIEDLPDHYRTAILLLHIKGLSYAEAGQKMNRSEESVRKLWVRALAQLHRAMEEKP